MLMNSIINHPAFRVSPFMDPQSGPVTSHQARLQGAPHVHHQVTRETGHLPEPLNRVHTQGILSGQEKRLCNWQQKIASWYHF